ncbi:MAG: hypothetical protein IT466_10525, partial [Moraxellaceae bacterium]|nr:hypothetical protein [Moraxellaceae bacterium]
GSLNAHSPSDFKGFRLANAKFSFVITLKGLRPQTKGFVASTAESTGMTKQAINRALARADALGDDALAKVTNTSLDSGHAAQ